MSRITVTGGAGFIGSALVDRLLAEGHHVEVLDDLSTGSLANLAGARREAGGRLKIHQCDVRDPAVTELLERHRPEIVFHLAGATTAGAGPVEVATTEVVGAVRVLEGAVAAGAGKVILAGSVSTYVAETPRSVLRRSVAALADAHRRTHGLACTDVDLPTVYGPRQLPGRAGAVVATFAERLVGGKSCVLHGGGRQTRDLLFVDDAVDALDKATGAADGLQIAVGTGVQTSVRNLYRAMAAIVGSAEEPVDGAARPADPDAVPVDPARARMYLGWQPFTELAEGLTDTLASFSA